MSIVTIESGLVVGCRFNSEKKVLNLRVFEKLGKEENVTWDVAVWGKLAEVVYPMIVVHDKENQINGSVITVLGKVDKVGVREYDGKSYSDNKLTSISAPIIQKNLKKKDDGVKSKTKNSDLPFSADDEDNEF